MQVHSLAKSTFKIIWGLKKALKNDSCCYRNFLEGLKLGSSTELGRYLFPHGLRAAAAPLPAAPEPRRRKLPGAAAPLPAAETCPPLPLVAPVKSWRRRGKHQTLQITSVSLSLSTLPGPASAKGEGECFTLSQKEMDPK